MENGHLKIEPRLAAIFGGAILLAGMALGFFALDMLPLESKADAAAVRALVEQEISNNRLSIISNRTDVDDLQKWRSSQMEAQGRMEAKQDEELQRLQDLQQQVQQLQQDRHR